MEIVILDGYCENPGDLSWDELGQLGDLTVYDRTSLTDEAEIISRIGKAEVVLTNKTPITAGVLEACPSIQFIGVLATGYNIVDTIAAKERGIPVSNVPAYGTAAVSQFTIALLLELCHHIGHHSNTVRAGKWTACPDYCYWDYPLIELSGKTLGIIGFGRIGQAVAKIAKAMGMNILATGSHKTAEGSELGTYVDRDTLLGNSDVISLHCPLFPATAGMINQQTIAKMKDGVILLNSSRGGLVVEEDLVSALNTGKISGYAADVVSTEPIRADNPLLTAPNCILTPHIAWAPKESRQRIMDCTVENLRAFLNGSPQNVVNR